MTLCYTRFAPPYCDRFQTRSRTAWLSLSLAALALLGLGGSNVLAQEVPDATILARLKPQIKTGQPVLKFNGKDLAGFQTYLKGHGTADPNHVFTVADGVLRISGQDFGAVTTAQEFENYQLVVEWKWGGKTWPPREAASRDSGILLHCVGPDGAVGEMWMQSIECQIIEGGCGDILLVAGQEKVKPKITVKTRIGADGQPYFDPGGKPDTRDSGRFNWWGRDPAWKDVLGVGDPLKVEKPAGEWNQMEVICNGDQVTCLVNGVVVNQGTGANQTRGKLQFQSEGAEILFRKIEIRPVLGPEKP